MKKWANSAALLEKLSLKKFYKKIDLGVKHEFIYSLIIGTRPIPPHIARKLATILCININDFILAHLQDVSDHYYDKTKVL